MHAIALLLLSVIPPGAPGGEVEQPKPQPVQVAVALPRVYVITLPGCPPCERLKARLASLHNRSDLKYYIEDLRSWNARVGPNLQCRAAPVLFVWKDPSGGGVRMGSSATLADVDRALGRNAPQQVAGRQGAALKGAFLSVNGSDPGAAYSVTVRGSPALVSPNTEAAWREHVGQDHGYRNAASMTPQQLAQAHADAHR